MLCVSGPGEVAVDALDQAQAQDCRLLNAGLVSADLHSFFAFDSQGKPKSRAFVVPPVDFAVTQPVLRHVKDQ